MEKNNVINLKDKELTMSSREIAELCEKRHDHVIVDVEKLFDFYKETYTPEKSGLLIQESSYVASNGKSNKQYLLSKDAVIDLITGYSLPHRHAVNQRWQELESRMVEHRLPTNFVEALEMLVVAEKDKLLLQAKIDKDAPKVIIADMLLDADVGIQLKEFARIQSDATGLGRNKLYKQLREWKILDNKNKPFQRCIDADWFYIIERVFGNEDYSGINQIVMVSPKGQRYLSKRLHEMVGM